jgi:hypothetical protein
MDAVPAATPRTIPDAEPTDATGVVPELHVPPGTELASVEDAPLQNDIIPVIAAGIGLTVTFNVDVAVPHMLALV